MSDKWGLIKLGFPDIYFSKALNEALGIARNEGLIGNTLALYRYSSPFVIIGPKTSILHVNVPFCEENNIPIIRVITDGLVYLQGGQCQYTLVLNNTFFPNRKVAYESLSECTVKACQILGVPAYRRPNSNDVLIGGRKISGVGLRRLSNTLICDTILGLEFDPDLAEKVLSVPAWKFVDKKAKTVREWATSLHSELGKTVSYEEAESAIVEGFSTVLGIDFEEVTVKADVLEIVDRLLVKYRSEEWLKYGKWSPVKDYWRPK